MTIWTKDEIKRASAMWAKDICAEEIGKAVGRNRKTIRAYASLHRDLFPIRLLGTPDKPGQAPRAERIALGIKLYIGGMMMSEASREADLTQNTLRAAVLKAGHPMPADTPKGPGDRMNRAVKAVQEGMSRTQARKAFNVGSESLARHLAKANDVAPIAAKRPRPLYESFGIIPIDQDWDLNGATISGVRLPALAFLGQRVAP